MSRALREPRSGALQNRDRNKLRVRDGPGSAVQHFVLYRVRDKKAYAAFSSFFGGVIAPDALISLISDAL